MTDTAQTLGSYRDAPDDIKEAAASIAAWTGLTNEAAERSLVEGAAAAALFIERNRNAAEITRLTTEVERLTRERDEADHALVDKYRDPQTGNFRFPTDVAAIVRLLDQAEAELAALRTRTTEAQEG